MKHTALLWLGGALIAAGVALPAIGSAASATITASYAAGYHDVHINDYGARGLGTFRLDTGDHSALAFCLEAHHPHAERADAYQPVEPSVISSELDTLLFLMATERELSNDRAIAAAALVWYYSSAIRTIGTPVWSSGANGWAPLTPDGWSSLPTYSSAAPIGLRSNGTDLDAAEAEVERLFHEVNQVVGPWTLSADDGVATLVGPKGPIPNWPVRFAASDGDHSETATVLTDERGRASVSFDSFAEGAEVTVSTDSPGPHLEWDGDGQIQRMATATSVALTDRFELQPRLRYVSAVKESTDATIGVGGAEFDLLDGSGQVIATVSSGADGLAPFPPFDPIEYPPPYEVVEVVAPPGLAPQPSGVRIDDASVDPFAPTVVTITNEPSTAALSIAKLLDPDTGPNDLSGFEFSVIRRSDRMTIAATTRDDGITETLNLPVGEWDICESGRPTWAKHTTDTGCRSVIIDLDSIDAGTMIEVDYVNESPPPLVVTRASDRADGDQTVTAGEFTIVDRVELAGLLLGTRYRLSGSVVDASDGAVVAGPVDHEFVADSRDAALDIVFEIEYLTSGDLVVVQTLTSNGIVVAEHRSLDNPDQTISVQPPATTIAESTSTTSEAPDTTAPPAATTVPVTTVPPPATTVPSTTTWSPDTTVPVVVLPPTTWPPSTEPPVVSTLPDTGIGDHLKTMLRLGDIGFVTGIGLVSISGLGRRRKTPNGGAPEGNPAV